VCLILINFCPFGVGDEFELLPTKLRASFYVPGFSGVVTEGSWDLTVIGSIPTPDLANISNRLSSMTNLIDTLGAGEPWDTFISLYRNGFTMPIQFAGMALMIIYALDSFKSLTQLSGTAISQTAVQTSFTPGGITGGVDDGSPVTGESGGNIGGGVGSGI
jgi:hypothetical protein